jgi:hypothetical protein
LEDILQIGPVVVGEPVAVEFLPDLVRVGIQGAERKA